MSRTSPTRPQSAHPIITQPSNNTQGRDGSHTQHHVSFQEPDDQPKEQQQPQRPSSAFSHTSLAPSKDHSLSPTRAGRTSVSPRPVSQHQEDGQPSTHHHFKRATSPSPTRPPFRPSSARPKDATFYTSTYMSSATAGVRQTHENQRIRPASAVVTSIRIGPNTTDSNQTTTQSQSTTNAHSNKPATNHPSTHDEPDIPVRHTRRSSEKVHRREDSTPAPKQPLELTEEAIRAHYEPILAARMSKLEDVSQRLRKQESRLLTMQKWKVKALDRVNSEPNPLDYVLGPNGPMESQPVKHKRIMLQRILIRQYIRNFRLVRALKAVHRHLRAMLPLLINSPNSQLSDETRRLLEELLTVWGKEPIISPFHYPHPKPISRLGFEPIHLSATSSMTSFSAPASPGTLAARKQMNDFLFYRQHPNMYTDKLLTDLFKVVPLLEQSLHENLQAKKVMDEKSYNEFVKNTTLIHQVASLDQSIAHKKEAIASLRADVELIEEEMKSGRKVYEGNVNQLEELMKKEQILLRKLNHMYYKEVSEKLGEPYAVQLSIVQQGQPYTNVIGPPPPGLPTMANQLHQMANNFLPSGTASFQSSSTPTSNAIPPSVALQTPNPNISHLFLPNSIHGTSLPAAPTTIPSFVSTSHANSGGMATPTTIPLTPLAPLPANIRTFAINKHETLGRVDHILAQNPNSAENQLRRTAERASERKKAEEYDALVREEQDGEDDQQQAGFSPFFVLKSYDSASEPFHVEPARSGDVSDASSQVGEDERADEAFAQQREYFKHGLIQAAAVAMRETPEEKEASEPNSRPPRSHSHRDPSLRPPTAPIPPLHSRSISEIDWLASGPSDKSRPSTAAEKSTHHHDEQLTNPYVAFPTREEEEEAFEAQLQAQQKVADENASHKNSPGSSPTQTQAATPATTNWWSRKAVHAPITFKAYSKPRPPSSKVKFAPVLPPSPVPGMSPEVYQLSFQRAVASLIKLGYPPNQALDFAPHLVLAGVVQARPKVVQITVPNNVATIAMNREKKRLAAPSMPTVQPLQPTKPVSEELAWIAAMPTPDPYVVASPSKKAVRPSSAHPSSSASSSSPSSTARPTTMPARSMRPGSAALHRPVYGDGSKSAVVRPTSAVPSSSARINALFVGMPTGIAAYQPPKPIKKTVTIQAASSARPNVTPRPPTMPPTSSLAASIATTNRRASLIGALNLAATEREPEGPFLLSPRAN